MKFHSELKEEIQFENRPFYSAVALSQNRSNVATDMLRDYSQKYYARSKAEIFWFFSAILRQLLIYNIYSVLILLIKSQNPRNGKALIQKMKSKRSKKKLADIDLGLVPSHASQTLYH